MRRTGTLALFLALGILSGCASSRPQMNKNLMADRGGAMRNLGVAERYTVGSPDVLEITVPGYPDLAGPRLIAPDGRIDLGRLGKLRVEGYSVGEIRRAVADRLRVPAELVDVQVAVYQSQVVYLFGEVNGSQRAVAYHGQETVLDLLQRTGGITPGAAPEKVWVVRSRLADAERPEVFHVDLPAILMKADDRTNIRLQPFDQVHVGEASPSRFEKYLPRWLRPFYRSLLGTRKSEKESRKQNAPV
jgi:protein involved in polysaccharide export with SLBB domain